MAIKFSKLSPKWYPALFVLSVLIFLAYLQLYTQVLGWELPKTQSLRRENARLKTEAEILNKEMDLYEMGVAAVELRDEDVYRSIFGLNSIPFEVRNEGMKGNENYGETDEIDRSGMMSMLCKRSDALLKEVYVQSKSFDEIELMLHTADNMATSIPAIAPMVPDKKRCRISSPFGFRDHPFGGYVSFHRGIDIATKPGNAVYATGDAVVEAIQVQMRGYGRQVVLDHGFGYKTRYAHLNNIYVTEGMKVKRGDRIASAGNTGLSSGPHLHYEVIYKGQNVNPYHYFDWDMPEEQYEAMVRGSEDEFYIHPMHRKK